MYTYTYIVTCVFLIVGLRTTFRKNIKLNYAYVSMNSYLAQVLPFALSSDAYASYTGAVARASM